LRDFRLPRPGWLPPLLYAAVAVVLIGHGVLPHFGSTAVGYGPDPPLFMWDLKWWPQSIADGLNPLHVSVAYAPEGFDTTLVASMASPSLLLTPLTQIAGPLISYNVLTIAAPALNAWAAYLLCRACGAEYWPAVAGGYLFGFSTYVLGQSLGHPFISLVAALPLAAYFVVRYVRETISRRWFLAGLSAVLVFQFLDSTEVLLTATMLAVPVMALAYWLYAELRPRLLETAKLIVLAFLITAVVVSPYLIATLTAGQRLTHTDPIFYALDPVNLVIPTRLSLGGDHFSSINSQFTGNLAENGAYFGLPLLAALGAYLWSRRRDRAARLLAGAFGLALVAAMGPRLILLGDITGVRLPWTPFIHLPLVEYALPARIVDCAWLALAVAIALWLSQPRARLAWAKWALVALGAIAILPDPRAEDPSPPSYGKAIWATEQPLPRFFRDGERPLFEGRPNLLVAPYNEAGNGIDLYWQANTGMAYEMPGGYLSGTIPDNFSCWPIVADLRFRVYEASEAPELMRFLAAKQVRGIVFTDEEARTAAPLLNALPWKPERREGVVIYRVPPMPKIATCPSQSSPR
jgi:hypothetical protein